VTAFCLFSANKQSILGLFGDIGVLPIEDFPAGTRLLKIPAPLACYWLGASELQTSRTAGDEE